MRIRSILTVLGLGLLTTSLATAQDIKPGGQESGNAFPPQDHYSPYAGRNFPTQVLWGDTHLHTGMSLDAGAFGARLTPVDAYRFARGEEVTSSTSWWQTTPTTWASSRMLLAGKAPPSCSDPTGKDWYDRIKAGEKASAWPSRSSGMFSQGNSFPEEH